MAVKNNPKNPKLSNYPSEEFLDLKQFAAWSVPKGHCQWLQQKRRFNQFYERAKELGLEVVPTNVPPGHKLTPYQTLLVVVDHTPGRIGSLKLLQFAEEFKYGGADLNLYERYRGTDLRKYVV